MSIAKGTVQTQLTSTVSLVKLSTIILERQVHIGKILSKKELDKNMFHHIVCFNCRFFDLEFWLKSFWTETPTKILRHKNNIIIKII